VYTAKRPRNLPRCPRQQLESVSLGVRDDELRPGKLDEDARPGHDMQSEDGSGVMLMQTRALRTVDKQLQRSRCQSSSSPLFCTTQ